MRRWLGLAWLLCLLGAGVARADEFQLPGLDADASAYAGTLQKRFPAGGTPKGRAAAEQAAAAALARKDFAAAAAALEQRLGMGADTAREWLDLATAELRRAPAEPEAASLAAWRAFAMAQDGDAEVAALLLLAEALRARGQDARAVQALEQVVQRAPDDAGYQRLLADARQAAGMQVRAVKVEGEADPPRACVTFTIAPTRRADFVVQDWVRLDPPVAGAAVTREGDALCVSGLPSGATTRAIFRAGLPSNAPGVALAREAGVALVVPDRAPAVLFDTRLFVLPRGQAPAVTLTTTNVSSVALSLLRLSERGAVPFLRDNRLGDPVDEYSARAIGEQGGREVWKGHIDIADWKPNQRTRTALPLPAPLLGAGAGLYALVAAPGDGTRADSDAASVQMIVRTDLAPTVWRGADGITAQVRGYGDARARAGVALRLLARNNDVLGEGVTDAEGVARFAASLLRGEGPLAAAAIDATTADGDYCVLDLNAAAFDLSDRGVEGAAPPGPLDAFVWFDRGIYRPGETVQVMALLRDDAGRPVDFPARVTVRRPNGQVFARATPARTGGAAIHLPVALSAGAAAGTWTVEVQADPEGPAIGAGAFRVEAFVPDRMAVDLGAPPPPLVAGREADLPVTARFLYGAPGAGLGGKGRLVLTPDPAPFPALAGYRIGLVDEQYVPVRAEADLPPTDAQGRTAYAITLGQVPDTTQALHAEVSVEIDDPSGHAARARTTLPVRPGGPLIGVRPAFEGGAVDAGAEAGFDVAAVDPDGARVALAATLRLVRERPDWHTVLQGRFARYEVVYRDEPLETRDIAIPAGGAGLHVGRTLPFGRYRLEVTQAGGLAATSVRFSSGWGGGGNADVPDRVDVSTATREAKPGQSVRVHIAPPFAGPATLLVLNDRVLALRTLDVPEAGLDVDVPVEASWGAGAYVAVHVFRPAAGDGTRPGRAIGLTWIGLDPAARTLPVSLDVADEIAPRARAVVPVRAAPGAWVTLAAVDEGILRLTEFASPDPLAHFLGRRRLGIDIRDDWGRLIAPAEGEVGVLREGGDAGGFALPDVPQHTVVLFAGPVRAGADGVAQVPLDVPDFNGQVRLMAVGWDGERVGAASRDVFVRDRLVAEALLPRFLAPGDHARLAVQLHDLALPAGTATVTLAAEGPLAIDGPAVLTQALVPEQRALVATSLYTTGAGRGVLHLDVAGPEAFHVRHDYAITVRPARAATTAVAGASLAPGAEQALAPPVPLDRYVPGTVSATATFGAPVRYDADALLRELAAYRFACLEQSTSRGLPLTLRGDTAPGVLQPLVESVLDRQRYDGGFALWSAGGEAEPWLSSYATEFLLRARAAGVTVPAAALDEALRYLAGAADGEPDAPDAYAEQAYRLYVLAFAGQGRPGAARVLVEHLDALPTPLARAQVGAALALAHDAPRAEAAFAAALDAPARDWWRVDYGTALRDRAAVAVLLRESGLLAGRLTGLVATLPGADLDPRALSTQELAWATAAAAVLGRAGPPPRVAVDGMVLPVTDGVASVALGAPARVRNDGAGPVWQSVSVRGVPLLAAPAQRAGMRVTRQFFTLDGAALDLDHLTQNTDFVLLLEGRAEDGQAHQAMLQQGLPAGWEIAGRLAAGPQAGMAWLGELSPTEAEPAADDRFAAVLELTPEQPAFRVAARLRAVTPGDYELPGADVSDMYRPAVFARQGVNRIKVLGGE